ncbi:hypothetical protein Gpo141_00010503 [Globisporangium polare]
MLSISSRIFTISAALAAVVVALYADSALATTTGYGSAVLLSNGGVHPEVLHESDSSSVVVAGAGLDRAMDVSVPLVANEASTNLTTSNGNGTASTSTSTSTTSSTVNGVPVTGTVRMTVNGVPVATQNITASGGNSTSVSISTITQCNGSSGCTTTTTTGAPLPAATPVSQIEERLNTTSDQEHSATPTPASIEPAVALLPAEVRAIAP